MVVVAPDSFKGSLSAEQATAAISAGVRDTLGEGAEILQLPMADGGEGTLAALLSVGRVDARTINTVDPLGRPTSAAYGISPDGHTGVMELAQASGLPLVDDVAPQPRRADTFGTGMVAAALLDAGVQEMLLCLGGSASTDGGTGILAALGARFLDVDGNDVAPGGQGLAQVVRVDDSGLHPRARAVRWRIAVDVANPLTGPQGAAAVFGPQKGATAEDVAALDRGLTHLAGVLRDRTGVDLIDVPGNGAAGGVPLAMTALLGAETTPGAHLIAETLGVPAALAQADLLVTGEGSLDGPSVHGKVVGTLASLARQGGRDTAVVVIAGLVRLSTAELRAAGVDAAFSIADGPASRQELVDDAATLVRSVAASVAGLYLQAWRP